MCCMLFALVLNADVTLIVLISKAFVMWGDNKKFVRGSGVELLMNFDTLSIVIFFRLRCVHQVMCVRLYYLREGGDEGSYIY